MGMISETEAHHKSICCFCERSMATITLDTEGWKVWRAYAMCPECWKDSDKKTEIDQLDFKLSSKSPIPIVSFGAINISWLMMHHPKCLIGSHITVEDYGLTAKFTIIPPTIEASEKIVNTMRKDRENRNRYVRPSNKRNAPTRYTL